MVLLIKNGRVIDPFSGTDDVLDVRVEKGKIKDIGKNLSDDGITEEIDAKGLIVVPGLIDIHTQTSGLIFAGIHIRAGSFDKNHHYFRHSSQEDA